MSYFTSQFIQLRTVIMLALIKSRWYGGSTIFVVLHVSIALAIIACLLNGKNVAGRELNGDVFSSPETLVELHRSENIIMGELSKYLRKHNIEHEFLEK